MAAVQACRRDLQREGAAQEVLTEVERILVNEAQIVILTVAQGDGSKKRKAARSASQEALRAEIARDAKALVELGDAHKALAKRKVTKARLVALAEAADALSGKLAERTAKKGDGKAKTLAKAGAIAEQTGAWGACYRLLALAGQKDERIAALLKEAVRPGKKKK